MGPSADPTIAIVPFGETLDGPLDSLDQRVARPATQTVARPVTLDGLLERPLDQPLDPIDAVDFIGHLGFQLQQKPIRNGPPSECIED